MKLRAAFIAFTIVGLQASSVRAVVTQLTPAGFLVRLDTRIAGSPDRVYRALVGQVGEWWNAEHTYSGDSRNLSIDARPGGCFCERLPNGGGVEHLRVIDVKPGEMLRMSGALGPLQASAVAGTMTWTLAAAGPATTVNLSYAVGGFRDGGFPAVAPAVDGVLLEQLQRLKRFVETGNPRDE
jgi:uncharacterized protein YndB with AHSA1/START domain